MKNSVVVLCQLGNLSVAGWLGESETGKDGDASKEDENRQVVTSPSGDTALPLMGKAASVEDL